MAYNVMIVDDEPWAIIDLLKNVEWDIHGFQLPEYYSKPSEALESICQKNPAVVFTDIKMPKFSGFDLIEKAQANGVTSKFVILSAYFDFDLTKHAIRLGVVDYCLKPIITDSFTEILGNLKIRLDDAQNPSDLAEIDQHDVFSNNTNFNMIIEHINKNLGKKILLHDISEQFFLNRNYICSLFQKYTNTTFTQYLTDIRINEAKKLLTDETLSLDEIAKMTGFNDSFYFNKVFKRHENITPGVFRKIHLLKNTADS